MDDIIILDNDLQRIHEWKRRITAFISEHLKLKLNNKTSIRKASAGVEFVGSVVRWSGIQLRKKSKKHIKHSLIHCAKAYAEGRISYERATATLDSYFGLLKHGNNHNLRRWIADHIVFRRKPGVIETQEDDTLLSDEWIQYFIVTEDD